ncbi:hypothetical protein RHGRI_032653 [Rhododendron griersonianum]|uniref:O-acyltransferase WSD1 C-terminal domain-containing protein n=1 Tax=Rhododendron griersonianum TaxID=479676 RepID=A0AAV6IHH7_9ERIC|nr:hypothetical protein RHGRI_032653 [Rhododendron griersonianum]
MGYSEVERDEPLSPLGRLFLSTEMHQIVHCIMGCENPIDVAAVTSEIANSVMIQLPRFSSLLVRDSHDREHWRKTQVNVPRHVIVVEDPVSDAADEEAVNDYVADLAVSVPLSSDKPLWEIVLRAFWVKDKRTAVSGGAGVELWPRKLATAKFWLDDMKVVKKTVAHATINDVLIGVISSGLSRYLDLRSPRASQDGVQITGLAMVNLRKQSGLQAITMHMLSYAGRVDMQILVAKDILPDPQVLAKCFEDALHQMKEAANKE